MNESVNTVDAMGVIEESDSLAPKQRAYWQSVIEHDMCDNDKPKDYLTLDEFEQKLTAAAIKLYA